MTTVRFRGILLVLVLLTPACTTGGRTALITAAQSGDIAKVKKLLDDGADVEAQTDGGRTALHVAAKGKRFRFREGHYADVVKRLLEHGADAEAREKLEGRQETVTGKACRDQQGWVIQ